MCVCVCVCVRCKNKIKSLLLKTKEYLLYGVSLCIYECGDGVGGGGGGEGKIRECGKIKTKQKGGQWFGVAVRDDVHAGLNPASAS